MSEDQELIVVEDLNPAKLFKGDGLDALLATVSKHARKLIPDVTTATGRKQLASFTHKIAKSKTALDLLGKNHVDATKKDLKKFDANRKKAKDYLTDLQAEIRKPLTDWEDAKQKKEDDIVASIQAIAELVPTSPEVIIIDNINMLAERLAKAKATKIGRKYGGMAQIAITARDDTIASLETIVSNLKIQEEEKIELDKLRAESEKQRKKDNDVAVAARARALAEEKTKQAVIDKERAEKTAADAIANAGKLAEKAASDEREKIAAETLAVARAKEKREDDRQHKGSIHRAIVAKIVKLKLVANEKDAKSIVEALARKLIPHTEITY